MDGASWYDVADARGCWLQWTAATQGQRAACRGALIARLQALAAEGRDGLWPGELPLELYEEARRVLWGAVSTCGKAAGEGFTAVAGRLLQAEEEAAAHRVQSASLVANDFAAVAKYLEECSVRCCSGAAVLPLPAAPPLLQQLTAASPADSPLRRLPSPAALADAPHTGRPHFVAAIAHLTAMGEQDALATVTDTVVHASSEHVAVYRDTGAAPAPKKRKKAQ
eukprot:TRINITY_DN30454_c0_g1_i1.p1 TRINITY_DN30454_c0_g1~~TRINITY_DN30454_c0_g1_i1.p1  ORF type:complete len:224 (+),score=89.19 TRINITY_DN30454_c0_g1_i1:72-743(+)